MGGSIRVMIISFSEPYERRRCQQWRRQYDSTLTQSQKTFARQGFDRRQGFGSAFPLAIMANLSYHNRISIQRSGEWKILLTT
jgi:hypothetical protein